MTKADLHRLVDGLPEGAVDGAAVLLRGIREGRVDPEQAWFWTPEWLAGELEADEDLAKGRVDRFQDEESFLAALEADEDRSSRSGCRPSRARSDSGATSAHLRPTSSAGCWRWSGSSFWASSGAGSSRASA